jgi:uncharacterized protein YkwD
MSRGFDMPRTTSGRRLGGTLAFLMSGLLFLGTVSASAMGDEKLGPRRHMLALTNSDRVYHDRATLSFADRLAAYAKSHSEAMANKGYIYHSTGDQLREALEGYTWELGGENVGVGGSLESLEDAFMASDLHRKNILRRTYDHAAVGIARADDRIWITVIFYG